MVRITSAESEFTPPGDIFVTSAWLHADVTTTTIETLTAADRCDRCGARAYVRVQLPAGELLFCSHHGRKHAAALADVAVSIQDESDRLLAEFGPADARA